MNRRALLAALGSGSVAGCVSGGGPSTQEPTSPPPTSTSPPPEETLHRRVSLTSQDALADEHELRLDVEILEPRITDNHTALIRITTTNEGQKRAVSVGRPGCDLLNRSRGGSDTPAGLWLHTPDQAEYIDRVEEKWVADYPADRNRAYAAYGCMPTVYDAGDSLSNEYEVWDNYQVERYLTPGAYRWEEDVQIWEDETAASGDRPNATVTWGFSLSVETLD